MLAVSLLILAIVPILTINAPAAMLGIWSCDLILLALEPCLRTPGTVFVFMVRETRMSLCGECILVVAHTRATKLRLSLRLLFVAVLMHGEPTLLDIWTFLTTSTTICICDVPPTWTAFWFVSVLFKYFC